MKKLAILFLLQIVCINAQEITVSSGKIDHIEKFKSAYVDARNVDIWLPDGYSKDKQYAVLYMHDGQMLFDAKTTWNKQEWGVDETASKLIATKETIDFIVVGISSISEKRHADYFPQKPFDDLSPKDKTFVTITLQEAGRTKAVFQPVSDNYLKFIVEELKPYIDQNYATAKGPEHTFIMGSSMGGLISLYAICEYPTIFGGAACISTHWPGIFSVENNPIPDAFFAYMRKNLPDPKTHKIYFDFGTATLDALYPPLQKKADEVMIEKGFTPANWETHKFEGADHSENAWKERLSIPILFLLETKK
jgi:predicted alpha/beta superfamily hydrolase